MMRSNASCVRNIIGWARRPGTSWRSLSTGEKPKVVVISGPTAVGKTRLACRLAEEIDGELVSCDSVKVYKYLDVGSNKALPKGFEHIRRHLTDVADPSEHCTAANFASMATDAIEDIVSRGKTPIVVGGSSFYGRWLVHGPISDAKPRSPEIQQRAAQIMEGWPESAKSLNVNSNDLETIVSLKRRNDFYRFQRAIEMVLEDGCLPVPTILPSRYELSPDLFPYDFRCVYVDADRHWLSRQMDARCEVMLDHGLLSEVLFLVSSGKLHPGTIAAKAIGYRQTMRFIEVWRELLNRSRGRMTHRQKEVEFELFVHYLEGFQAASRKLSRKQRVWARRDHIYHFHKLNVPKLPSQKYKKRSTDPNARGAFDFRQGLISVNPQRVRLNEDNILSFLDEIVPMFRMDTDEYWHMITSNESYIGNQEHLRTEEPPRLMREYRSVQHIFNCSASIDHFLSQNRDSIRTAEGTFD